MTAPRAVLCSDSLFSDRLPRELGENALSLRVAALKARGETFTDLTLSNPTQAGLQIDAAALRDAFARDDLALYRPEPRGLIEARAAVAEALGGRHARDDLILTASTSEAYSWLFKLLCAPGDEVLVPRPSYPLFDHLTQLEGVSAIPYRLSYAGSWQIDLADLAERVGPRTRAILVVSPNNPTGSFVSAEELAALAALCGDRMALISDEVFAEYPFISGKDVPRAAEHAHAHQGRALTFSLGGLSKLIGLPQMKLGWIAVSGPADRCAQAIARLELIADTFLSVATPIQLAASALLQSGRAIREQILARIRGNRAHLQHLIETEHPSCTLLPADGGWSAVIRVPAIRSEEELVLGLLDDQRVLVHPGYFFDFPHEAYAIVSLLPAPEHFREGVARLLAHAAP